MNNNEVTVQTNNNERDPRLTKKNPVLKKISDYYGDEMYQLCYREFKEFILKHDDLLLQILEEYFPHSKVYTPDEKEDADDYNDFVSFIMSMLPESETVTEETEKTAEELLDEAGYILYECHTEEDIQSFRKYYDKCGEKSMSTRNGIPTIVGDELCTFNGGRLNTCRVFWVVRKDVDKIKRSDKPKRDDEYGTSVMSIQFTHNDPCRISIKNRYNHNAKDGDPDRTLGNNLDRIIPGLTKAFEKKIGKSFSSSPSEYRPARCMQASDGKFYKINAKIGWNCYCSDNTVISETVVDEERVVKKDGDTIIYPATFKSQNKIVKYPKDHMILMDYFLLDIKEKTIKLADDSIEDSFIDTIPKIEKIRIEKGPKGNRTVVINDVIKIGLDINNRIIEYVNPLVEKIGNNFFVECKFVKKVELPNVKEVGNNFMDGMISLKSVNLESLEKAGDSCLENTSISEINFSNLKEVGNDFLNGCRRIEKFNFPNLEICGDDCFGLVYPSEISFPKLRIVGNNFFNQGPLDKITELKFPELEKTGDNFFGENLYVRSLYVPKLKEVGFGFFAYNKELEEINMPSVITLGGYSFASNSKAKKVYLPEVVEIGNYVLNLNWSVEELNIGKAKNIGRDFLSGDSCIENAIIPEGMLINGVNTGQGINRRSY